MSEIVLSATNLVKKFGGIVATNHVSLSLERGARHALIGPNGSGKTTLINLLTGVLDPTGGRIILNGHDITTLPIHKRVAMGMVRTFQINQLFDSMTPLESLTMVLSQRNGLGSRFWEPLGGNPKVVHEAQRILESFHLAEVQHVVTKHLAYGKRRLLEIAVAIACRPSVLLLDEPVAGVPSGEREEILRSLAALPTDVSILLIEHDMDLVFSFARSLTVLVNGTVLVEGTPEEISQDVRVRDVYLGHAEETAV